MSITATASEKFNWIKHKNQYLDCAWAEQGNSISGICFLELNLKALEAFSKFWHDHCKVMRFNAQATFDTELIALELLSNALYETFAHNREEHIIIRWYKRQETLRLIVLDFGPGLDLEAQLREVPASNDVDGYLKEVEAYREKKITIAPDGNETRHIPRLGKGLQIVKALTKSFLAKPRFQNKHGAYGAQVEAEYAF